MLPIVRVIHQRQERRRRNQRLIAIRRNMRDTSSPFELPNRRFTEIFRLDKENVRNFIQLLTPHLIPTRNLTGITPEKKIFLALRFFATGTYQRCLGEQYNFGMSQSSVHFAIHQVTEAIATHLAPIYIVSYFRRGTKRHKDEIQRNVWISWLYWCHRWNTYCHFKAFTR